MAKPKLDPNRDADTGKKRAPPKALWTQGIAPGRITVPKPGPWGGSQAVTAPKRKGR